MIRINFNPKFWLEESNAELPAELKLAYIYFMTNDKTNLIGIYQLPDKYIKFEFGINDEDLKKVKEELTARKKVVFIQDWIAVINFPEISGYGGSSLKRAMQKQWDNIPEGVRTGLTPSLTPSLYPLNMESTPYRGDNNNNNNNDNNKGIKKIDLSPKSVNLQSGFKG